MSEHFNRSLSTVQKGRCVAVFKWKLRLKVKFLLANGGQSLFSSGDAIVIRRVDVEKVHDYARLRCELRDYLFIRLPMKIGLRTTEIATLEIEEINFENRSFNVLDSKKHRLYPLPLDVLTLQLIKDLIGSRIRGYVFSDRKSHKNREGEPLGRDTIWYHVHRIGKEVGVEQFNPRLLRHYFAACWHEEMKKPHSKKTMEGLRRILRHKNPAMTYRYLARLVFFEDLQAEYNQTQQPYILEHRTKPALSLFYQKWCSRCIHQPVCRIIDQMCSCLGATGCRFYKQKKEVDVKFETSK